MSSLPVVEARGIGKVFGGLCALREVDLALEPGERVAVLGANGAGKSTLLRVLATLVRPSSGSLRLFGFDPWRRGDAARASLGFLGHQTWLYGELSAEENLRFYAEMYRLDDPAGTVRSWLGRVGLWDRRTARAAELSRGQQQRLGLARALLHEPRLLLLDEPDTGLDAAGLELLADLVTGGGSRSVVFSSHSPERARAWSSRVTLLEQGRCISGGPTGATQIGDAAALVAG